MFCSLVMIKKCSSSLRKNAARRGYSKARVAKVEKTGYLPETAP